MSLLIYMLVFAIQVQSNINSGKISKTLGLSTDGQQQHLVPIRVKIDGDLIEEAEKIKNFDITIKWEGHESKNLKGDRHELKVQLSELRDCEKEIEKKLVEWEDDHSGAKYFTGPREILIRLASAELLQKMQSHPWERVSLHISLYKVEYVDE